MTINSNLETKCKPSTVIHLKNAFVLEILSFWFVKNPTQIKIVWLTLTGITGMTITVMMIKLLIRDWQGMKQSISWLKNGKCGKFSLRLDFYFLLFIDEIKIIWQIKWLINIKLSFLRHYTYWNHR